MGVPLNHLQRHGFANVAEPAGGVAAWETAGLPLNPDAGTPSSQ